MSSDRQCPECGIPYDPYNGCLCEDPDYSKVAAFVAFFAGGLLVVVALAVAMGHQ